MAEEVNYASVVFKSGKQAPPEAKKEEETVYDEVKVKSETTDQTADTNDEKENNKLACCLGILCVILLVGLIAVVVVLSTLSGDENETTLLAEIHNMTNLNKNLSVDNDHLRMERTNLRVELSNLTKNYNVLENNMTNLTTQNQELENQKNNLIQQIQDMKKNWNEGNISRAQWTIDIYCKEERKCTTCRKGWLLNQNNCYVYHNAVSEQITWEEALENCRGKGSDLAVAHSEEEKNAINDYSVGGKYWIGLKVEGGIWKWIDGTVLSVSSWIGEPTEGHCGVSVQGEPWSSALCGERRQWMCVQKALSV